MENTVLIESFGRTNVQHRLWYVMESSDLSSVKAQFGDRAHCIKNGKDYYFGNDDEWYDESGNKV